MTYAAKILADSVSPDGVRLTTFEVVIPRIVLAELNTHRWFSRNSASSRAIPVKKMIQRVMETPYIPSYWGKNQKGMQSDEEVSPELADKAKGLWLRARDAAVDQAIALGEVGIHKQFTNRLLEPFMWHTCIITATEWDNFEHLRCHKHAHPDIRIPAEMMQELRLNGEPKELDYGEWHLPLVDIEVDGPLVCDVLAKMPRVDLGMTDLLVKVSCGRCARISYLTHEGKRDVEKDIELCDGLTVNGHMSPLEHAARPMEQWRGGSEDGQRQEFYGNFRGWVQFRKTIQGEADMLGKQEVA